jgi:hypothetical protein
MHHVMNPRGTTRWTFLPSIALALAVGLSLFSQQPAEEPRPGKYRILSYGGTKSPPLYLGYFVLEGKTYKAFLPGDKLSGEGQWSYDAVKHSVIWESGPYKNVWGGAFTIDREGKTHKIRLKSTTIATLSAD